MKSILFSAVLTALAAPLLAQATAPQSAPTEKAAVMADTKAKADTATTPKERAKVAKKQSRQGKKAKKAKSEKQDKPKA
jgi:hypothetical protein